MSFTLTEGFRCAALGCFFVFMGEGFAGVAWRAGGNVRLSRRKGSRSICHAARLSFYTFEEGCAEFRAIAAIHGLLNVRQPVEISECDVLRAFFALRRSSDNARNSLWQQFRTSIENVGPGYREERHRSVTSRTKRRLAVLALGLIVAAPYAFDGITDRRASFSFGVIKLVAEESAECGRLISLDLPASTRHRAARARGA
jgi:hypothetical protein